MLPQNRPEFVSACTTCRVPSSSLILIIVKVSVPHDIRPEYVKESARNICFLFDARKSVKQLRRELTQLCSITCTINEPSHAFAYANIFPSLPRPKSLLAEASSSESSSDIGSSSNSSSSNVREYKQRVPQPLMFDDEPLVNASVTSQLSNNNGVFRKYAHGTGAIYAYKQQVTQSSKSVMCVRDAIRLSRYWMKSGAQTHKNAPNAFIVDGMARLTGYGKPTSAVHEEVVCKQSAECNCFIERSVFRAQLGWVSLHCIFAPNSIPRTFAPWASLQPWLQCSFSTLQEETKCMQLYAQARSSKPFSIFEFGVRTIVSDDKIRDEFIDYIAHASALISPYFAPCFTYILSAYNQSRFEERVMRATYSLLDHFGSDESIYSLMYKCPSERASLNFGLSQPLSLPISTYRECTRAGYAGVALVAFIVWCKRVPKVRAKRDHERSRALHKSFFRKSSTKSVADDGGTRIVNESDGAETDKAGTSTGNIILDSGTTVYDGGELVAKQIVESLLTESNGAETRMSVLRSHRSVNTWNDYTRFDTAITNLLCNTNK